MGLLSVEGPSIRLARAGSPAVPLAARRYLTAVDGVDVRGRESRFLPTRPVAAARPLVGAATTPSRWSANNAHSTIATPISGWPEIARSGR